MPLVGCTIRIYYNAQALNVKFLCECSFDVLLLLLLLLLFLDIETSRFFYIIPYPTAFPYGNGMVLHFYQQQESSTTKTVHRVINKGLKTYV